MVPRGNGALHGESDGLGRAPTAESGPGLVIVADSGAGAALVERPRVHPHYATGPGLDAASPERPVAQPPSFTTRRVDAGCLASFSAGRTGRRTSSPPQLGQRPPNTPSAHPRQKVHSKEQILASAASGGRSRSQHS